MPWFNLAGEETGMREAEREKEQLRRAKIRLRLIQHYDQVTKNISQTSRFLMAEPRAGDPSPARHRDRPLEEHLSTGP